MTAETSAKQAIDTFELTRDEKGRLVLKRPGVEDVADVRIRRAFPLSQPLRNVSIRSSEGKELLLVSDLSTQPPEVRQAVEDAINTTTFVPVIQRVDEVDVRFGYQQWKVHTDRGPAEFRVQEREDIRFLHDGRFRIKDADGNLYDLPTLDKLDQASQKAVEPLI